jgi:hypothetical protein
MFASGHALPGSGRKCSYRPARPLSDLVRIRPQRSNAADAIMSGERI